MTQYLAGAAILTASFVFAYINAADPLLSASLAILGLVLGGLAAAGRHQGGKADPA